MQFNLVHIVLLIFFLEKRKWAKLYFLFLLLDLLIMNRFFFRSFIKRNLKRNNIRLNELRNPIKKRENQQCLFFFLTKTKTELNVSLTLRLTVFCPAFHFHDMIVLRFETINTNTLLVYNCITTEHCVQKTNSDTEKSRAHT